MSEFFFLDLADVQSVTPAPPAPIGTKKVDERGFFDVSYVFYFRQIDKPNHRKSRKKLLLVGETKFN